MMRIEHALHILRNRPESGYKHQNTLSFVEDVTALRMERIISMTHHPVEFDMLMLYRMKGKYVKLFEVKGVSCFISDTRTEDKCNSQAGEFLRDLNIVANELLLENFWRANTVVFLFDFITDYRHDLPCIASEWIEKQTKSPTVAKNQRQKRQHKSLFFRAVLDILSQKENKQNSP